MYINTKIKTLSNIKNLGGREALLLPAHELSASRAHGNAGGLWTEQMYYRTAFLPPLGSLPAFA
jgi:hypothetical protein